MERPNPQAGLDSGGCTLRWLIFSASSVILLAAAFVPLSLIGQLHICLFRRLTGYPCMFCGLTRAFIAMAHGDIPTAWHIAPIGVPLFLATVAVLLWSAASLFTGRPLNIQIPWRWILPLGAILLLINWIYRLWAGLK